MALGLVLVALGALCRLVPHPMNFVPIGAIALFAAARLPRRWAWLVPVTAMVLADLILNARLGQIVGFSAVMLTSYATFAVIALLGGLLKRDAGAPTRVGASLGASTLFFLTTNFAVWAAQRGTGIGLNYGEGLPGLLECYAAALPFFDRTVLADLLGTAALFGLDALALKYGWLGQPKPASDPS